ncbi:MAG: selenocysteine-specific translation elongation factor [Gammaproteobacteria bacterium]
MIVATAGHVDHGKTLLVEALTGVDTDRLPEEKQRGLTIELGFAYHDLGDGRTTGFIDVPGHERFIRTMVAGVSGIDVVLFIVAADDGPMPQTAEHLAILDLLGVTRGVVALTKIDRVSEQRLAQVTAECRELLAGGPLAEAAIVPVSALEGYGIEALRGELLDLAGTTPPRAAGGNFRLAIDRSFLLKGAGRVVTGTVFSGGVDVNDAVHHVPGGGEVRARGIHAQNAEAVSAQAGQRTALNLAGAGLRDGEIHRGDWIVAAGAAFATKRFDAEIRVLAGESRALRNRTPVHVHIGAADVTGRVVTFDGKAIEPGSSGLAQVLLDRELHCVRGDRLVLRDQSARRTIAGGRVLDPLPDVRGRSRRERSAYLEAMREPTAAAALTAALAALPDGVDLVRFRRSWNLNAAEAQALEQEVPLIVLDAGDRMLGFEPGRFEALKAMLPPALEACHAAAADRPGATEAEIAKALPERLRPALLRLLADTLVAAGTLEREGALLRLPGHRVRRSPADEALWRRVEPLLRRDDGKVPVVHDMLEPLGVPHKILEAFLTRSAQQGHVVKVSSKRYFLPQSMARFEDIARALAASQPDGVFSVADFRNESGIGRNAVVEILEYFDRVGLTRRHGQVRKLIA